MDLITGIETKAVLFLGKCGGLKKKNQVGDLILPIAAIRGDGTSDDYLPAAVPALPAFSLQKAISTTIRDFGKDYYERKGYGANKVWIWSGLQITRNTNFHLEMNGGDQIDYDNSRQGKQFTISPNIDQKIGRHFTFSVNHRLQLMTVDSKRLYNANVSNVRFIYQFNRRDIPG